MTMFLYVRLVAVAVTYQTNISADSYIRWFRKNRFKVDPLNVFRGFKK